MVDIHSHLIFGVDDGSPSIKESMRMVLEAERLGIKAIIATPHYRDNIYSSEKIAENFMELVYRMSDCGVDLHLGHEVFIGPDIAEKAKLNKRLKLAGSSFILIELPLDIIPVFSHDTIYKLQLENMTVILAHPERNRHFVNNFNAFIDLVERGCLLQLDAASIIGVYGADVKNFARKLIELRLAHFVASDAHCTDDYTGWYLKARNQVFRWAGEEYAYKLFSQNPMMILKNRIEENDTSG